MHCNATRVVSSDRSNRHLKTILRGCLASVTVYGVATPNSALTKKLDVRV